MSIRCVISRPFRDIISPYIYIYIRWDFTRNRARVSFYRGKTTIQIGTAIRGLSRAWCKRDESSARRKTVTRVNGEMEYLKAAWNRYDVKQKSNVPPPIRLSSVTSFSSLLDRGNLRHTTYKGDRVVEGTEKRERERESEKKIRKEIYAITGRTNDVCHAPARYFITVNEYVLKAKRTDNWYFDTRKFHRIESSEI